MVFIFSWAGASACIWLHRLPGEPIAFGEDFIDLVNGLSAVAGRMAGPERYQDFQIWRGLPPLLQTNETLGLAGEVFKCGFEGLEPVVEARCTDPAIGRWRGNDDRAGCRPQRRNPWIVFDETNARFNPPDFHHPDGLGTFRRIKELR